MRKVLISILVVLLIILTYFLVFKDLKIAKWENKNINDIKSLNKKMNEQIDIAKQLNNQKYPESTTNLEKAIEELQIAKEKYESKLKYVSSDVQLGVVKVKEYKIERLWIALELYAKEENVELKLDILDTGTKDVYDLEVTVVGSYIGITDFIYDIEKDDTLGFKILNFKLVPNTIIETTVKQEETNKTEETEDKEENKTNETTNPENENEQNKTEEENEIQAMENDEEETTTVKVENLKATFKIENVGIDFE